MKRERYEAYSRSIGREMPVKIYGHAGRPILVIPSAAGNADDFEHFGMVAAVSHYIENGHCQLFCIDSIDSESWLDASAGPDRKAARHNDYDRYIAEEVVAFIRERSGREDIVTTGCSLGAYHSVNLLLRHPNLFNGCIALSGCYHVHYFVGSYVDDNVYFNAPLLYLPNLEDPEYLDKIREAQIFVCTGQGAWEDEMRRDTAELRRIFAEKSLPGVFDFWGFDVNHDWPWWQRQLPYFLSKILFE